jgi:hypothetical protein
MAELTRRHSGGASAAEWVADNAVRFASCGDASKRDIDGESSEVRFVAWPGADAMPLSLGVGAGQAWCGWAGVAGGQVGGAFDAVGVVPSAFDRAGAGAVTAWRVGAVADLVEGVGQGVCKVLRG